MLGQPMAPGMGGPSPLADGAAEVEKKIAMLLPEEQMILAEAMTPEAVAVLAKVLPPTFMPLLERGLMAAQAAAGGSGGAPSAGMGTEMQSASDWPPGSSPPPSGTPSPRASLLNRVRA